MKKIISVLFVLLLGNFVYSAASEEDLYCSLLQNTKWVYNVHNKAGEKPDYERYAEINGTEIYDGLTYLSFYSADADARYLMRRDDSGIYIKSARYAVPFLSFFHFDIIFTPAVYAIKFPLRKGDTWTYEGVATINALFLNFPTKIWAKCTHMGKENIDAGGTTMPAYRLYAELNREGMEKTFFADFWFGKGVGLVGYESEKISLTLKSVEVLPDAINNSANAVK